MEKEKVVFLLDAAAMGLAFFTIFFKSFQIIPSQRFIHYLLGFVCGSSAICYFMMMDNILLLEAGDGHPIQGAQYLDWVVTTPTMLVVVGLMGRFPHPSIFGLCCLDIFMNICGLLGEYTSGVRRWVYFIMGCFFFIPQWVFFLLDFDYALMKEYFGDEVAQKYFFWGQCIFLSRVGFPVIWVLQMAQLISYFTSLVLFSVMAMIAKIGLCAWVMLCLQEEFPEDSPCRTPPHLEPENALSMVRLSKTNSTQSTPPRS
jgi:sensory rhodopsin